MPDSTSFGVGGKTLQTSARRTKSLNKSASGNRLNQNDPHPPTIDDKDFSGLLRGGLCELRDQQPHKPFVPRFQLREFPAETLDLAPLAEGQLLPVEV
jgi:hypothetical protein